MKKYVTGMAICVVMFFVFAIGYNMYINSVISAEVDIDPNPTVYVGTPEGMSVEGVLSKEYRYDQDIILNATVVDPSGVVSDYVKWSLVVNGTVQAPIATSCFLRLPGGTLKPGKHTFLVTYSNTKGYGAEFEYDIIISEPVAHTKLNLKQSEVKWHGYVNHNNGTVTHMKTGLTWMVVDDGYDKPIQEALKYAKSMSAKTGKTWSIPTIEEWTVVANMTKTSSHVMDEPFQGLKSGAKYWTRSTPKNNASTVYTIEVSRIVGGGQNLRAQAGIVPMDASACYTILVTR